METSMGAIEVIGFVVILASASIVFLSVVSLIFGKMRNKVLLGLELLAFFTLVLATVEDGTAWLGITEQQIAFGISALKAMLCLSAAFTLNAALSRYVWNGLLAEDGLSTVPKLLTDFATAFIYITAIMLVMHFVYDKSVTALAATSGAFVFIICYSAQSTLGEVFAGLSLNLARDLSKGDNILVDGIYGTVSDIQWRSVSVHQWWTDSLVIFPNNMITRAKFTNFSRRPLRTATMSKSLSSTARLPTSPDRPSRRPSREHNASSRTRRPSSMPVKSPTWARRSACSSASRPTTTGLTPSTRPTG